MVGQEAPLRHAGKVSHYFSRTPLLVSECRRGTASGATIAVAAGGPRSGDNDAKVPLLDERTGGCSRATAWPPQMAAGPGGQLRVLWDAEEPGRAG